MDKQSQDSSAGLAERYLSPNQASRGCDLAVQTVTRICRETPGLAQFVAGRWLIDKAKWDAFLRARAGGGHAGA